MTTRPVPNLTTMERGARVGWGRAMLLRATQGRLMFLVAQLPTTDPTPDGNWPVSGPTRRTRVVVLYYDSARKAFRIWHHGLGVTWGQIGRAWVSRADMLALFDATGTTVHDAVVGKVVPA